MVNGMKLSDEELCKVVGGGETTLTQEEIEAIKKESLDLMKKMRSGEVKCTSIWETMYNIGRELEEAWGTADEAWGRAYKKRQSI